MKKDDKTLIVLIVGLLILFVSGGYGLWVINLEDYKVVEGVIVDVDPVLKEFGDIDYYIVTFEDDTIVNVKVGGYTNFVDFTKGSRHIISLYRYRYYDLGYWYLDDLVKVPDNVLGVD